MPLQRPSAAEPQPEGVVIPGDGTIAYIGGGFGDKWTGAR